MSGVRIVGELAGERAQVTGVFVEAREQGGEAAGDIAELITRGGFGKVVTSPERVRADSLARRRRDRAQRQPRRKGEDRSHHDGARGEREVEHVRQGAVAQADPAIGALRHLEACR